MDFNFAIKKLTGIVILFSLAMPADSLAQNAASGTDEPSSTLQGQLNAITSNYIELKDAFVNNNADQAAKEAIEFIAFINEMDNSGVEAGIKKEWVNAKLSLIDNLDALATSRYIKEQRVHFEEISSFIEELIEKYGPVNQTLYKQHCPMAFQGEGASWLNEKKEILNPYGGKKMLHCGSIVKKIERTSN